MNHRVNKKNIKINKNLLYTIFLSILVLIITSFYVSLKENFHIDELFTYGLSNNSFQLIEDDYKLYTGYEVLLNYTAVKSGGEFNFKNVFFNQRHDTHPPFYYILIHIISSIFKNKFSKWIGLSINIVFMLFLFFEIKYIINELIDNKYFSTLFSIMYLFFYGSINVLVFTRMYILLQFFSLSFFIILYKKSKDENKKQIDYKFLISVFLIFLLGGLTQYHFYIFSGLSLFCFSVDFITKKDFKTLFSLLFTILISFFISYMIFPEMKSHIMTGDGLHSINSVEILNLYDKIKSLVSTIVQAYFGYFIVFLLCLCILVFFIYLLFKKKLIDFEKKKLFSYILLITFFYFLLICLTVKFTFARYLFNIYPFIAILIFSMLYLLFDNFKLKYISILLIICLIFGSRNKAVNYLMKGDKYITEYVKDNSDSLIILLYSSKDANKDAINSQLWKLPYPIYTMRYAKKVIFVDTSKENWHLNNNLHNLNNFYTYIYTIQDDEKINNLLKSNNNASNIQIIYKTNYITVYKFF